jgi:hypothetical protein
MEYFCGRVFKRWPVKLHRPQYRDKPGSLEPILVKHLESSKNIGPMISGCVDSMTTYPVLDRCGIKCTPRADGFHAFRRAASKYIRKAGSLELAAMRSS